MTRYVLYVWGYTGRQEQPNDWNYLDRYPNQQRAIQEIGELRNLGMDARMIDKNRKIVYQLDAADNLVNVTENHQQLLAKIK